MFHSDFRVTFENSTVHCCNMQIIVGIKIQIKFIDYNFILPQPSKKTWKKPMVTNDRTLNAQPLNF